MTDLHTADGDGAKRAAGVTLALFTAIALSMGGIQAAVSGANGEAAIAFAFVFVYGIMAAGLVAATATLSQ